MSGPPPATHSDPDLRTVMMSGSQESVENKAYLLAEESGGRWGVLGKVDIEDNMWVIARGLSSKCTLFAILMIPRSVPLLS